MRGAKRSSGGLRRGVIWLIALLLFPASAFACLWDSDTLRAEAAGLPGLVDLLTGRFEREPALYYEMRLARVESAVESTPDDLGLYDDAAVACDRLGRSDSAIEWMARKRDRLDRLAAAGHTDQEHEYRYLANLGTFHAHRWMASGANREAMDDLTIARDLIKQAIELNPDAHFGRETYQLMAIEWMIAPAEDLDPDGESMASIFDPIVGYRGVTDSDLRGSKIDADEAVKGLSGLIALGSAWESIDLLHSLTLALEARGDHAMAHLARLRCIELAQNGKRSLDPTAPDSSTIARVLSRTPHQAMTDDAIDSFFPRARRRADEWKSVRDEFMLARLQGGSHPDTHPDFWTGYREVSPITIPNGVFGLGGHRLLGAKAVAIAATCVICILGLFARSYAKRRRRALAVR